jgi:hypothetical protein
LSQWHDSFAVVGARKFEYLVCAALELVMSKAGGVVLILTGLGVGAYGLYAEDEGSRATYAPATITSSANMGDASKVAAPELVVPVPKPAYRPLPVAARPAEPVVALNAPVVVTLVPRGGEPLPQPARGSPIPKDRDTLARELQKELRRVGCYDGELNGVWTQSTRRAMKAFTDRINASLPVDEPDAVLFALVHGQRDPVCGQPCPTDQGLSQDGRCVPNPILAKAARKGAPATATANASSERATTAISGWSTVTRATPDPAIAAATSPSPPGTAGTQPPIAGRMALAGPPEGDQNPAQSPLPGVAPSPRAVPGVTPPKRSLQGEASWMRSMRTRYFGSPN